MKKIFFVFLFTFLGLVLSMPWFIKKCIIISFNQISDRPLEYQIFWTDKDNSHFNEKTSMKYRTSENQTAVVIKISTKAIKFFRLDIGVNPGKVKISDLKINNKKLNLIRFNKSADVESLAVENGKMTISSNKHDPYLVYKDDVNAINNMLTINYAVFALLFFLWSALSYVVVSFVYEHKKKIDAIFVVLFGILICIPMLHISNAEKSKTENRMLNQKPNLFIGDDINNKYGIQFDDYFNDRFFGRNILLNISSAINKLLCVKNTKKVLIQDDNWLFYKLNNSLRNYANMDLFSESELKIISKYLQDIDNWCKNNDKQFVFVIAPDKNKIYGNHIKDINKINPDSKSRARQLIEYLQNNTNIKVVYPYDDLLANKDKGLLYYKNDTHWNSMGAYIGYTTIMKVLNIKPIYISQTKQIMNTHGDLTNMSSIIKEDNITQYTVPIIIKNFSCDQESTNVRTDTNCKNNKKIKRLFTLRDSFTSALGDFYNNTFKTVNYKWRFDIRKEDLKFIKNNADIVILESVERSISVLIHQTFPKE